MPPLPSTLAAAAERRRWVTPEPLNVAPALIGLPLATPTRRALAMALDLLVVAMLSGVSGFWLLGGLALVLLQLRSQRGERTSRRMVVGWVFAGLLALLALQEALDRWEHRGDVRPALASAAAEAAADAAEDGDEAAARVAQALQAVAGAASAPPAAASAVAPAVRIAQLEAELAEARKPQPFRLREQFDRLLEAIGASFGWGIVYFSLLPAWWGGQTLGKKVFGLQVVELTGKPMTVLRCLKRYGGYAAGMATGGLGFLQMLWDHNRQGLQDKAAHTVVLDRRAASRGLAAPPSTAGDTP